MSHGLLRLSLIHISTKSNRVDIGVRVELPALLFSHLTDELYESKIVYRTQLFEDNVRTFCKMCIRDRPEAYAKLNIKAAQTGYVDFVDVEIFTGDELSLIHI